MPLKSSPCDRRDEQTAGHQFSDLSQLHHNPKAQLVLCYSTFLLILSVLKHLAVGTRVWSVMNVAAYCPLDLQ
jgi:hypothetical protein